MTKNRKPQPVNKTGPAEDRAFEVKVNEDDFNEIVGDDIADTPIHPDDKNAFEDGPFAPEPELVKAVEDLEKPAAPVEPEKPLVYLMKKNPQTGVTLFRRCSKSN